MNYKTLLALSALAGAAGLALRRKHHQKLGSIIDPPLISAEDAVDIAMKKVNANPMVKQILSEGLKMAIRKGKKPLKDVGPGK